VLVTCSDGRLRHGATTGPGGAKRRAAGKRGKAGATDESPAAPLAPATTRAYATYEDPMFNQEISVANLGSVPRPPGEPRLAPAQDAPTPSAPPDTEMRMEPRQVAAIRDYRAEVAGKKLRILRGEFHRHTEISGDGGGDGSLLDMWRYGLDMAALDWIGCGDHDNGGGREFSWWFTQKTTSAFVVPERFNPMYTYERSVSYPDGHRNAVFARPGIRPLPRLQAGTGKANG
jgi:hypothetical protein